MKNHIVLRIVSKSLIPFIMLFALYVQFHGDFGPGGGFQAGVIFAAAFVLYTLIFGLEQAEKVVPPKVLQVFIPLGVMIYIGTGFVGLFKGGNFLNYDVLAHTAKHGQHWGIFTVELGVGMTVASVITTIFFTFVRRGRMK